MKKTILAIATLSFFASQAWATEELIKNYRGIRSLGMGGVVTTTGRYDEALFGNPANQLEDENWKLTLFSVTAEVNNHILSDQSKIRNATKSSGTDSVAALANSGIVGTVEHERVTLLVPAFYSPHFFGEDTAFAFGLLVNEQLNMILHQDLIVDAQATVDIGPSFGIAHRYMDGNLNVGFNLHLIYRMAGDPNINATNFLSGQKLSLSNIAGQGAGVDGDIGALYKLPMDVPFFKKVSFGASISNIMQSTYRVIKNSSLTSIQSSPPNNDRVLNLGTKLDLPDLPLLTENIFALEMQDIGTTRRLASFWKKLHMGAETKFLLSWLSVRAGINEGYFGGGVGLSLPLIKIDVATYGEELGGNAGVLEDRRYALRLSFDI
jgi:hypothetical protein